MFVRFVIVACVVLSAASSSYASTFNVTIGEKYRVRIQRQWPEGLNFDLCNSKNCSTVNVYGYGADGGLNYFGYVGCDQHARNCEKMYNSGFHGNGERSTGELILGLERRRDGLSLWKDGHPLKNMWIPTPQDFDQLTIRPDSDGYSDLSIELSNFSDKLECTSLEYQCSDGRCISQLDKCNGVKDCSDGADEEQATCDLAIVELTEEIKVVATVQYQEEHRGIIFLFCNNTGCNNVLLAACSDKGGFWYTIRQDNCNIQGAFCNGGAGSTCLYEESLPDIEMRFEITLTSYKYPSSYRNVDVRTQDGDYWASLFITAGYNQLRIKPELWNSDMPVKFDVIPLTTSTTASTPSTAAASTAAPANITATTPASVASTTSPTPDWPPTPAPTWCDPTYENLLIPVVGVCDAYTVCYSGRSQRMHCPAPLQFHYELQTCDWPSAVQCV